MNVFTDSPTPAKHFVTSSELEVSQDCRKEDRQVPWCCHNPQSLLCFRAELQLALACPRAGGHGDDRQRDALTTSPVSPSNPSERGLLAPRQHRPEEGREFLHKGQDGPRLPTSPLKNIHTT